MTARRSDLAALGSLCVSLSEGATSADSLALADKMAGLKAAFEALDRNAVARKRALEDGLKQVRQQCSENKM